MRRVALLSLFAALAAPAQVRVFTHATLIDGTGAPPIEDAVIVVRGEKIAAIGPSSKVKVPSGADVVDLSGKVVVPGIINLHGHVGNTKGLNQDRSFFTRESVIENLRTYAEYGVTTTTSMGTDEDSMIEFRDERNRNAFMSARVLTALQGFTTMGGYPTTAPGVKGVAQETASASQARVWVDETAKKGADLIKMWVDTHHGAFPPMPREVYAAVIDQAHKNKLPAFAHVYALEDAKGLIRSGIDILGHSVRDFDVDQEFIGLMKKNGVYYAPTITRELSTYVYANPPKWLDDPFFKQSVSADVIEQIRTKLKAAQSDPAVIEQGKKDFEMAMRNAKKLVDAGVNVAFGTDTGPVGRFPGYFEHWEAELMVEAGIKPLRVIEGWSKYSSQALRIDKNFGTLEKGKVADMVVLDASPLEDIRNTRKINAVYFGGKKFE
ncbi:MAG: amidohydrolase family protein [Bryobacterales bacterium]|nr:amidohydrolase family protein [Acidobacteriota bacterium]MCB9383501.1 amidohydrolase family protein [Bryobacterales bacterium]